MDAPDGAVRRALRRTDVWTRTVRALGAMAELAPAFATARDSMARDRMAQLADGDLLRIRREAASVITSSPLWPSRSLILRVALQSDHDGLPALDLVAGPLGRCSIGLTTAQTGAGTLVTVDVRVQAVPAALTPTLRRRVLAAEQMLLGITLLTAREPQVVVAGAVISDGAVLVARRTAPPDLAGFWELPGGKVKPGETEPAALQRELAEELGLTVAVADRIGPDVDLGENRVLRCYRADTGSGLLRPNEHDAVQWVKPDGLDDVKWLAPDRLLIADLRRELLSERPV